ncbi:MAG: type II toxin-antitoxin system RelE/ParE family toxin [Terracidiphilus sp.]
MVVYKLQNEVALELRQTETFRKWRVKLKDERARALIASRLDRLAFGNAGDAKPVGKGISELRIDYGPGYRIYFKQRGNTLVILLCGGNKRTQIEDIKLAKRLTAEWRDEDGEKIDQV